MPFSQANSQGIVICPVTGVAFVDPTRKWMALEEDTTEKSSLSASRASLNYLALVLYNEDSPPAQLEFLPEDLAISCVQTKNSKGCLYVIGGKSTSLFDGEDIFFKSFNGTHWLQEPSLPKDRRSLHGGGAAVIGNRLYAVGFSSPEDMASFDGHEGQVYVLGGYYWVGPDAPGKSDEVSRFLPPSDAEEEGTWEVAPPLLTPRSGLAACVAFGRLFTLGGSFRNEVESFDGETWRSEVSLRTRISGHSALFYNGLLYISGGYNYGQYVRDVVSFTGIEWNVNTPMLAGRAWHACELWSGTIYCLGGDSSAINLQATYSPDASLPADLLAQMNLTKAYQPEDLAPRAMEYLGSDGYWRNAFPGFLAANRNRHAMVAFTPQ